MVKRTLLEIALPGIRPERESSEAVQVLIAPDEISRHLSRIDPPQDFISPFQGVRVGREERRNPSALSRPRGICQHFESLGHLPRVIGLASHVPESKLVRLPLVFTPIGKEEKAEPGLGRLGQGSKIRREDRPDPQTELR